MAGFIMSDSFSFIIWYTLLSISDGSNSLAGDLTKDLPTNVRDSATTFGHYGSTRNGVEASTSVFLRTVNVTDISCGQQNLCQQTLGRSEYPASCFRCESCHCDDLCHLFGDCCNDKLVQLQPPSDQSPAPYITCVPKLDQHNRPTSPADHGVLQVHKCPAGGDGSQENVIRQCEHPDLRKISEAVPVYSPSSGLTYRNKFCAICHKQESYEFWNVSAKCNVSAKFADIKTPEELWEKAWASGGCAVSSAASRENVTRPCRLQTMVDTCRDTNNTTSESRTIAELCEKLTNPAEFNRTLYKNVFCAVCNGISLDRSQICKIPEVHKRVTPVPPISVLLNFYPDESKLSHQNLMDDKSCQDKQIYNHFLAQCCPVVCPPRRMYDGTVCQPVFRSCAGLGYSFSFTLLPDRPVNLSSTGYLTRQYKRRIRTVLQPYQPYVLTPLVISTTGQRFYTPLKHVRIHSLQVSFKFVSSGKRSMNEVEGVLQQIVQQPWAFTKDNVVHTFRLSSDEDSARKEYHPNNNIEVLSVLHKNDSRAVFGRSCLKRNCLTSVHFIDLSNVLHCPSVELPTAHFGGNLSLQNLSLTVGNETVLLREEMFMETIDGIRLCVSELTRVTPAIHAPVTQPSWRATFSTICLTVSDICLFLTFLVYITLPSLQTLPGKNTMALVCHLFVAQFLYLCGVNATSSVVLCQILGVVIHYMWLSSFFWMFVCAYHMYTVFSNLLNNSKCLSKERNERRQFMHYFLFADLSPLVLVFACIGYFLGQSGGQDIGYGGDICFLNSMGAVGIFFASPLLLILIFNFFFFIRTVLSIRRTPDIVSHNSCNRNRNYVGIYFRLSLLLGFGWIFGFFPSNIVVFCLFSIFTGGQGIFIFASFCINRRVLILLAQKLHCSTCRLFVQLNSSTKSTET